MGTIRGPHDTEHNGAPRRLAVCVDDFGLSKAVNRSVFDLAARGRISAASCMVDAPCWQDDLAALREQLSGIIDLGLHLNLSESLPARPSRHGWGELVLRAYARALDSAWLQAEIERQMDAFVSATGRPPDFIDGHRHVHQLPGVRETLVECAARRRWRLWWRSTAPGAAGAMPRGDRLKAAVIDRLGGAAFRRLVQTRGPRVDAAPAWTCNAHLLGVYGFSGNESEHLRRLDAWLRVARDGDLLMCHTAEAGEAAPGDAIAAARRVEYRVLAGPDFEPLLQRHRVVVQRLSLAGYLSAQSRGEALTRHAE